MRISPWRLLLTGGAIVILAAAGLGLAAAAGLGGTPATDTIAAAPSANPDASAGPQRKHADGHRAWLRNHLGEGRLLKAGRHLVHAEVTVTGRDGNLVTLQFDHGTIQSIDADSITIAEAGGSTVMVATDDATKVRVGRELGGLDDLKAGDEIFVQSRIDGTTLAKHILKVPAKTDS
jgi:uncharacterized protein YciI